MDVDTGVDRSSLGLGRELKLTKEMVGHRLLLSLNSSAISYGAREDESQS